MLYWKLKKKQILWVSILSFFVVLLLSQYSHAQTQSSMVYTVESFDLKFPVNSQLLLQGTRDIVITIDSGLLNGSNTKLSFEEMRGSLNFYSNNAASGTLAIENIVYPDVVTLTSEGITFSKSSDYNWIIIFPANQNCRIGWQFYLESYIDKYTYTAFGLIGVGMMIFAPSWAAWKIKEEGLDPDAVERIAYSMIIFFIGLGLAYFMLWGG